MPPAPDEQTPKRRTTVYYSRATHTAGLARKLTDKRVTDMFRIAEIHTASGVANQRDCGDKNVG